MVSNVKTGNLLAGLDRCLLSIEAERKLFHAAWAIIPAIYYFGYPRDAMLALLLLELLIWIGLEAARKMGYSVFSPSYLRPHEKDGMPVGTLFQIASLFLAVLLFDRAIAVLAMMFNCIGDSATALAGAALYPYLGKEKVDIRHFGYHGALKLSSLFGDISHALRHHKSPALMAVMLLSCASAGLLLYPGGPASLILAGAVGAMVADAFAWRVLGYTINDDLSITLLAGCAMSLAI